MKLLDSIQRDLESDIIDTTYIGVKKKRPFSTRKIHLGYAKHALVVLLRECAMAINRQKKVVEELAAYELAMKQKKMRPSIF